MRLFDKLKEQTNAIIPSQCYLHFDTHGLIIRFQVERDISPPILIDETMARAISEYLTEYLTVFDDVKKHGWKNSVKGKDNGSQTNTTK
jgi:hypothetical protein